MNTEYTQEAAKRYEEHFGVPPKPEAKLIPKEKIGLGYEFYPIVFSSKDEETLKFFFGEISIEVGDRKGDPVDRNLKKIKEIVCEDSVLIGSRPNSFDLGSQHRFFDPKEFDDALEMIRKKKNSFFWGIMHAGDVCYLREKEDPQNYEYFHQQSFSGKFDEKRCEVYIGDYLLKVHNTMIKDKEEARIFSWRMEVEVVSLKEEIEKTSIKLFGVGLEDFPKEEKKKAIRVLRVYVKNK